MKALLITINIILALVVVWAGFQRLEELSGKKKQVFTVRKPTEKKPIMKPAAERRSEPRDPKLDAEVVVKKDVFSQDRSPNSTMGGNARVELALVGTFSIGSSTGAIIKQKASARNNNFFPMGGPPMWGGGRQMGIGQRGNRRGGNPGGGPGGRPMGMPPVAGRQQQGANAATGTNQVVYKQYVRLGETLSNGYKLVDVQREKVTLQRGSDKLELAIEEASKNAPSAARQQNSTRNRVNNTTRLLQTMQNMQRMQMFQNFQMMRMMNNNNNNGGGPNMNNNNNNNRNSGYSGGNRRSSGNRAR